MATDQAAQVTATAEMANGTDIMADSINSTVDAIDLAADSINHVAPRDSTVDYEEPIDQAAGTETEATATAEMVDDIDFAAARDSGANYTEYIGQPTEVEANATVTSDTANGTESVVAHDSANEPMGSTGEVAEAEVEASEAVMTTNGTELRVPQGSIGDHLKDTDEVVIEAEAETEAMNQAEIMDGSESVVTQHKSDRKGKAPEKIYYCKGNCEAGPSRQTDQKGKAPVEVIHRGNTEAGPSQPSRREKKRTKDLKRLARKAREKSEASNASEPAVAQDTNDDHVKASGGPVEAEAEDQTEAANGSESLGAQGTDADATNHTEEAATEAANEASAPKTSKRRKEREKRKRQKSARNSTASTSAGGARNRDPGMYLYLDENMRGTADGFKMFEASDRGSDGGFASHVFGYDDFLLAPPASSAMSSSSSNGSLTPRSTRMPTPQPFVYNEAEVTEGNKASDDLGPTPGPVTNPSSNPSLPSTTTAAVQNVLPNGTPIRQGFTADDLKLSDTYRSITWQESTGREPPRPVPLTKEDEAVEDETPSLRGPTFIEPHLRASYFPESYPQDYAGNPKWHEYIAKKQSLREETKESEEEEDERGEEEQ
ncbi:hypothetical protein PG999_002231 [Apiospora kogelbergensis]|uniref:Uncharacterized protein n=1 Tax=Apiospora kogelbergensis TaxID=1337665 RepID=A0AAW0R7T6_9PEZI